MSRRILFLVLVMLMLNSPIDNSTVANPESLDDINVLMLVATGFGWNYFDINETFTEWGAQVDTVAYALDYVVQSCGNRPPRPITVDYLISDMTDQILSIYDCIIIPSGGHWHGLYQAAPVLDLIESAYEMGLVIATMCIGNVVVAEANDIINGTKAAYYGAAWEYVTEAGGVPVFDARVVSHNYIVTGGTGGGYPSGFETVPAYEVCSEIVRVLLGRSRVAGLILQPATGTQSTNQSITVAITDPYVDLPGVNSTEVTNVEICVYHQENDSLAYSLELSPPTDDSANYVGEIVGLSVGEYYFDIEVTDSEDRLEIVDTADNLSVETTIPPPPPIDGPISVVPVAVFLIAVVAVVLVVARKMIQR